MSEIRDTFGYIVRWVVQAGPEPHCVESYVWIGERDGDWTIYPSFRVPGTPPNTREVLARVVDAHAWQKPVLLRFITTENLPEIYEIIIVEPADGKDS